MAMPPCLRLADLRDLTDDQLRAHIIGQYIETAPSYADEDDDEGLAPDELGYGRELVDGDHDPAEHDATDLGNILVAYESVGNWGCDSSSYFLIERDGALFEVHGSHDSTCGFESQWTPKPVTPGYLVSRNWSMYTGGYDELEAKHKKLIRSWLRHRFGDKDPAQFKVPEFAIPTWSLHADEGKVFDLRYEADDFVRYALQRSTNGLRAYSRWPDLRTGLVQARNWTASMTNAVEQCRIRGLLPTVEDLWVAGDLASSRGHISDEGVAGVLARSLVDLWVGFGKHTVN